MILRPITLTIAVVVLLSGLAACERPRAASTADTQAFHATPTMAEVASWTVAPDAYGPLPLGAPVARATEVLGTSFPVDTNSRDLCQVVLPVAMPAGVRFMIQRDSVGAAPRLERVDVDSAGARTAEGVAVGDPESVVRRLYGARVHVTAHKYEPRGHYLIVDATGDTLHRIVFETNGRRVTRFRAGRRPAVDLVELCG